MRARSTSPRRRTRSISEAAASSATALRALQAADLEQGGPHGRQQLRAGAVAGRQERQRALEEGDLRRQVAAPVHLVGRLGETPRRAVRERLEPRGGRAQLAGGAVGALELRADAGARVGHRVAEVDEPAGQPLVRVGPRGQRHRLVGRVADQRVPEAKRALTGDEREGGAHELALRQRVERGLHPGASERGHERLQAADVEGLPFDRARLDEPPLRRVERVQAGGEQRVQGGRERAVLGALAHVGRELLEEERVAARPRHHAVRGPARAAAARALSRRRLACSSSGAGRRTVRAAHAGRASSSSGRPTHSSRTGAASGPPASWSMRSSSAGSAQCASSKASTSAPRRRRAS